MEKITVRIEAETARELRGLSARDGRSITFLVNRALSNYLRLRQGTEAGGEDHAA